MTKHSWTIPEIIEALKRGHLLREKASRHLLEDRGYWEKTKRYVQENSGALADAKDTMSNSILILIGQMEKGQFVYDPSQGDEQLDKYFMGIVKKVWLAELRKEKKRRNLRDRLYDIQSFISSSPELIKDTFNHVYHAMQLLDKGCREILELVAEGFSRKEIAVKLGYSEQTVKNKVSDCRKRLRDKLRNQNN